MSSLTETNYNTYDEYVPLLVGDKDATATQWPNARILLHMLKQQYKVKKTIKFSDPSEYGDAFNHETGQNKSGTAGVISDDYVVAMRAILNNPGVHSTDLSNKVTEARRAGGYIKAVLDVLYRRPTNIRDASGLIRAIDMSATVKGYATNPKANGSTLDHTNAFTVASTGKYDTSVAGITFNNHTYDGTDSKMIPFKFSRNLLKLILETSYQRYKTAQATRTSDFFNVTEVTGSYSETYFRKGTDPNKLFTTDANGKEIEVQKGSAKFMELTEAGDCFTLGLKDASSMQKCSKMIKDCLTGQEDGVKQCQTYMNTDFFRNAGQKEVDKMNPAIALDLLRSFGFAQKTKHNKELGIELVVVDSAREWINTLRTHHQASGSSSGGTNKLTSVEIDTIANQKGLLDYLELVSQKINSSPQILNPGYSGKKPTQNAAAFTGTTFHKYGMLPKEAVQGRSAPSLSSIVHIQNQVLSQRNLLSGIYGIPIVGFMQSGGSELQAQLAGAYGNIQPIKLSDYADNIFQSFLKRLEAFNKSLDNTDKAEVEKIIKDLKEIEAKLEKANKYTTQYSDMLSAHGDTAGSVISYDHIQKFVDKRNNYFKRSTTAQDKMFSIFEVMANVNNKEAPEESKSVGAYPDWITHN